MVAQKKLFWYRYILVKSMWQWQSFLFMLPVLGTHITILRVTMSLTRRLKKRGVTRCWEFLKNDPLSGVATKICREFLTFITWWVPPLALPPASPTTPFPITHHHHHPFSSLVSTVLSPVFRLRGEGWGWPPEWVEDDCWVRRAVFWIHINRIRIRIQQKISIRIHDGLESGSRS